MHVKTSASNFKDLSLENSLNIDVKCAHGISKMDLLAFPTYYNFCGNVLHDIELKTYLVPFPHFSAFLTTYLTRSVSKALFFTLRKVFIRIQKRICIRFLIIKLLWQRISHICVSTSFPVMIWKMFVRIQEQILVPFPHLLAFVATDFAYSFFWHCSYSWFEGCS